MSPNSLRVLAGAAAAVIVLLTGIAVGFIGGALPECPAPAAPASTPSATPTSATPTGNPGGINDNDQNNQGTNQNNGSLGGTVGARDQRTTEAAPPDARPQETAPAANQAAPQAATTTGCGEDGFSVLAAAAGVAGSGLAVVTLFAFLMAAQSRKPVVPVWVRRRPPGRRGVPTPVWTPTARPWCGPASTSVTG
jgi:hypothetical protein